MSELAGNVSEETEVFIERDTLGPVLTAFSMNCQGVVDAAGGSSFMQELVSSLAHNKRGQKRLGFQMEAL
ncbi:MAG: hypothetical protein GY822_30375 [Deltaproteobacteria bacterium]|nr:hypothetical protein [Deltaproteobacteria bacterium]